MFCRTYFTTSRASQGFPKLPKIANEPFLHYPVGSKERAALQVSLNRMNQECPEIPCIVGGKEIKTGKIVKQLMPGNHAKSICVYHEADNDVAKQAIEAAAKAKKDWEEISWESRAAIFMKAADLLSVKYRADLCASAMLGSGKNVWQAEIDAGVETIDFWRFGAKYVEELYSMQPPEHSPYVWNRMEYRPLEGFVAAITPFNFVAIGANLPSSPALVGNTVLWKPAGTALYSNYIVYKILEEAGLPPGVINFIPGRAISSTFASPNFAGLHFTGSTPTFQMMWKQIAENLPTFKSYPRIVGETGGKNFHFVHASCGDQIESIVHNTIRSAFEYQGQKCSACSRAYFPQSLWPRIQQRMIEELSQVKMGAPEHFDTFVSAVIDKKSFDNIKSYIDEAKKSPECKIIAGGKYDDSVGYYVEPTVIVTTNPLYRSMKEEIFGPVLTVYVYPDAQYEETLKLCDETSPYALTGALFSSDRYALEKGMNALRHTAGNFYVNDKSTGSIVGQQPFGGGRASGTNDKSGSALNLLRWVSARSIKENFLPATTWRYPHMSK